MNYSQQPTQLTQPMQPIQSTQTLQSNTFFGQNQQNPFIFNFQQPDNQPCNLPLQNTNPFNFNNLSNDYSFSLKQNKQDKQLQQSQFNANAYQYQQIHLDNAPLIDKIKNLKMNAVSVFGEKDIIGIFGEDVSGIDICCVRDNKIIAIKHDTIITGHSLKNLTHFLYSCNIVEARHGPIIKLFVGCLQFDTATIVALDRNKIERYVNGNQSVMTTEIANYVKTLFQ